MSLSLSLFAPLVVVVHATLQAADGFVEAELLSAQPGHPAPGGAPEPFSLLWRGPQAPQLQQGCTSSRTGDGAGRDLPRARWRRRRRHAVPGDLQLVAGSRRRNGVDLIAPDLDESLALVQSPRRRVAVAPRGAPRRAARRPRARSPCAAAASRRRPRLAASTVRSTRRRASSSIAVASRPIGRPSASTAISSRPSVRARRLTRWASRCWRSRSAARPPAGARTPSRAPGPGAREGTARRRPTPLAATPRASRAGREDALQGDAELQREVWLEVVVRAGRRRRAAARSATSSRASHRSAAEETGRRRSG